MGFVRTRATAFHSPSPVMPGVTTGAISSGRGATVVVVVVSPGIVTPVVVVVGSIGAMVDVVVV